MRQAVSLRPVTEDDKPLLRRIYASTRAEELGMQRQDIVRVFRTFNAYAEAFRKESETHEQ